MLYEVITDGGVQVSEGGGRARVGQVIRRYIHRLDGGDGAGLGGGSYDFV